MFEKNIGPHLFFQIPYLPHFFVYVEQSKKLWIFKVELFELQRQQSNVQGI
jgi:hypothetical protein